MNIILLILALFFILRLLTLLISLKNESRLKKEGAIEYGKKNSKIITILHVVYYLFSAFEAWKYSFTLDAVSLIGIGLFVFSYIILLYVIFQLRHIWTVKLYIAKEHNINRSFLFRYLKHPNYFLNIIPELIGIGLLCHSWMTMLVVLPLYLISLFIRIQQEEKVMATLFLKQSK